MIHCCSHGKARNVFEQQFVPLLYHLKSQVCGEEACKTGMLDELKCQRNSKQYHDANKMTPQGAVLQKNYTSIYKLFSVFNMQSHGLFYLPSNSIFYASQISCMIQDMTSLQCVFRIMHFPLSIFHLFQFVKQQNIIFYSVQKEGQCINHYSYYLLQKLQ